MKRIRKKELCRRGLALFLASVMLMSMSIATYADESNSGATAENDIDIEIEVITIQENTESDFDSGNESVNTGTVESYTPNTSGSDNSDGSDNTDDSDSSDEPFNLITQTERPEHNEKGPDVSVTIGIPEKEKGEEQDSENQGGSTDPVKQETPDTPDETSKDETTDDLNWDIFYDEKTDTYKLTFKIDEDAEGDQLIDLTKALELLNKYSDHLEANSSGSSKTVYDDDTLRGFVDSMTYPQELLDIAVRSGATTPERVAEWIDTELFYHFQYGFPLNSKFEEALNTWNSSSKVDRPDVLEPGDIRKFEICLSSGSKHTYVYKNGSFTLATPDFSELTEDPANASGVIGFDGQDLPNKNGNQNFGYVDTASYNVSRKSKAVIELMRQSFAYTDNHRYDRDFERYDECLKKYEETGDPRELTLGMFTNMDSTDIRCDVSEYLNKLYGNEGTPEEKLNRYLVDYYNKKLGLNCKTVDELLEADPDLVYDISGTNTDANRDLDLGNGSIKVGTHTQDLRYSNFYKNLLSFAYGDKADINAITGELLNSNGDYANPSWTTNGAKNALYYYMAHQEIWKKTDEYFQQLLDGGLTAEQATWSTFMMALNIDGVATGNNWQDTMWPWYNSIQLEQQDGELRLTKADIDTNETITASETQFQLWRIDKKIINEETGEIGEVKMYCSYDKEKNTYSFTDAESVLETTGGQLDILYTLLKDTVYYLQEYEAPEGYVKDPRVYVIMDESKFSMEECIEANNRATINEGKSVEGLTYAYLGSISSEKPLEVVFVNAKVTIPGSDPTPDPDPDPTPDPGDDDADDDDVPDEPTPLSDDPGDPEDPDPGEEIPDEPVPLAERPITVELTDIPDEDVPLAGDLVDIFDEDVPLADVPSTGDISILWYALAFLSGVGLLALEITSAKERKRSLKN